uniref:Variant surface glycoprotein 1125.4269 n=1 Tax=Trypanosoma brucei TaxID=5691 RepID=A0A1J0RAI0_9TRYP|nr:variant surface glycoprotein 1125.4269 [Trypanosoma brucei]
MATTLAVQTAVLAATITATSAAIHDNIHKVDSPCAAADYLLGIASRAQSKLEQQLTAASNTFSLAQRIKIAAAAQTPSNQLAAQLLTAAVEKKATEALSAANGAYSAIINGISAASQLVGTQNLLFELAKLNLPNIQSATDTTFTGAQGKALTPTLAPTATGECTTGEGTREERKTRQDPDPSKTEITLYAVQAKAASSTLGGDLSICAATSTASTATSNCKDGSGSNTNLQFIGGKLLELKENKLTRKRSSDDDYAAEGQHQGKVPSEKTIRNLLKKIKAMENAAATLTQTSAITDLKLISEAQEIKEAMARALKGEQGSYTDGKGKAEVDKLLKQAYGEDKKIVEGISKLAKEFKPTKAATGGEGDKQLQQIISVDNLAAAETYYAIKKIIDEEGQKKKNQASPSCPTKTEKASEPAKTADECKKHTTAGDCEKETGCDFDEKKPEGERCFPKPESNKKDEKSFSRNLRVSVPQVCAELSLLSF